MTGSALSVGTPCDERTPEQTQGGEHTTKTTIRCCRAAALPFPLLAAYLAAAPCQGFPPARFARPLTGLPPRRQHFFQEEEMAALSRGVCTLSEDLSAIVSPTTLLTFLIMNDTFYQTGFQTSQQNRFHTDTGLRSTERQRVL